MSELLLANKSDLVAIADKIRAKAGISNSLSFPQGFMDGIDGISGQGGSGGSASLNIYYGDTEPSDTSMLWCKCDIPSNVVISNDIGQLPMTINSVATFKDCMYYIFFVKVGGYIYTFPRVTSYPIQKYNLETGEVTSTNVTPTSNMTKVTIVPVVLDNNIYIFCGENNMAYLFDTTTETLTELDWTISSNIQSSAVGIYDNKIYFVGGYKKKTITVFDLDSKQCTTLSTTLSRPLNNSGYACFGSKIYLLGGYYYNSSYNKGYVNYITVFDCETETISTLTTTLPTNLAYTASATLGSKVYLVGGRTSDSGYSNAVYVFDVETETIETLSVSVNTKGSYMDAVIDGNDIYFVYDGDSMLKLTLQTEVPSGTLHIVPSLNENMFKLMNGNQSIDLGVRNVLLGNSNGYGEKVEAYTYKNNTWTQI